MAQSQNVLDLLVSQDQPQTTQDRPFYLKVEHVSSQEKIQGAWKRALSDDGVLSGKSAWKRLRKNLNENDFSEEVLEKSPEGYTRKSVWSRGNARLDVEYAVPLYTNGVGRVRNGLRLRLRQA